ncbi:O-acetylhomoserine sulfhydrylase [Curtobacterium sp. PhB25]|uniref:O-acetylhomoserine aminocarboxypropyltransferase/cysteine synthase family protein n=1 Tax=unclassified Curtobacterium TaxID=257496 RepID=UPI001051449F|nr:MULTISPECIES: PLP-dependent transferase [unclassified Curtobacterium]TCU46483.1 O-acetylhomoserine sulfhydrylase [Curtobacterium sp. PhB146]TDW50650.1 O-acetylhomoserine sulfhydrylase [Curtobacterium sp. PhB42]TDW55047.1 O-acetylhomoserine sulfhydrylase [Curtobacterium sp. PhB190]TDW74807.1 O-acetylhomoserine sulfhydrylase [Curtobacterium sp. PhB25]
MANDDHGFSTEQVHGGFVPDAGHGARIPAIHMSSGFLFDDFDQARDRFAGTEDGYTYTRLGNPTNADVERRVALLERGVEAILVGSGQAAATIAFLGLLQAGDHVVAARSIYEGTKGLLVQNLGRLGIEVDFVADQRDLDEWARLVRPNTKAFFAETIPNPKNDVLDITGVADTAHRAGVPLIVDNTLATPYLVRPVEHGADIVIHSASKFLSGHGAGLGGVVVDGGTFDWSASPERWQHLTSPERSLGGDSYVERYGNRAFVVFARDVVASRIGPTPSPFNAFLIRQGIETLSLRVERHSANALAVAQWLEAQPEVTSVDHAGLASSPFHDLAQRYLPRGAGSVFAFTLAGGEAAAHTFIDSVQLFSRMTHLGDVRSLILHPATTTHAGKTAAERADQGIDGGLIRLSVGIEDVADLLRDLERGFAALRSGIDGESLEARGASDAERASLEHSVPGTHVISEEL